MKAAERFHPRWRWLFAAPFLMAIVLMAALAVASIDVLSALRAFAAGESRWSKERKVAVLRLESYSTSKDPDEYAKFQAALALPLSCRQARLELERPDPDPETARRHLLKGGHHPEDVDGMVRLYRMFRQVDAVDKAIASWAAADAELMGLSALGAAIRQHIEDQGASSGPAPALVALREQLPGFEARLTRLETEFSVRLGEASRLSRSLAYAVLGGFTVFLLVAGLLLTFYLLNLQRLAAQALSDSVERWSLAAEAAGIGVFDWDIENDRIAFDARAAELYGLEGKAFESQPGGLAHQCVHADDLDRVRQTLDDAVAQFAPLVMRYRVDRPGAEGNDRHVELNARVRAAQGQRTRMVGILWDVSDDVQAERLRLDKQAAERANRAKGAFLSRVSHELRTPLNAVLGFSQLLQLDATEPLTPTQAERVQYVIDSGQHLLELINDMLDITHIEDGALGLASIAVDVVPLLNASRRRVEPFARERGISLACEWPQGEIVVQADPRRVEQVFGHLLSNAVKYNRERGSVTVACTREGGDAVIAFKDTGAGMSAQQIEQLFQPFNRLGAEFSAESGSGLGLVVVRQLLRLMGGSIAVASQPGTGTTFTMRLPLAAAPAQVPVPLDALA